MKELTVVEAVAIGEKVAMILELKQVNGRYHTIWGNKSSEGLGRVFDRIITENLEPA